MSNEITNSPERVGASSSEMVLLVRVIDYPRCIALRWGYFLDCCTLLSDVG